MQEELREARQEVTNSKLEFEEWKKEVSKNIDFYDETADKYKRMIKRTFPLHRMLKHMYRRNNWLQEDKKKLKGQIIALETQIEVIKVELKKRNLNIIVEIDVTP